jgi:hypothetical protein
VTELKFGVFDHMDEGVDPEAGPRQFPEALQLINEGLTVDELTFRGSMKRCGRQG